MSLGRIFRTDAPAPVLLVRFAVGFAFMVAGTGKLRDVAGTGGFFEGLGIPAAQQLAPVVGFFEVVGGALVLVGLVTRIAVLPLIAVMLVAIASTKLPILFGGPVGPFSAPRGPSTGMQAFLMALRLDFSMLMCTLFLLVVGAGKISADAVLSRSLPRSRPSEPA